jgi:hypothetical protein
VISFVIHDWQVVDHCNHIRRVHGALATGITGDFTFREGRVAMFEILAGNPQPVTDRVQGEQVFRACVDAIAARGAEVIDDDRQFVLVHDDRIEITYQFAVTEPEASPETAFATTGYQCSGAARPNSFITGPVARDIGASGTGEPGDDLFLGSCVHAEEFGDVFPRPH